jgi:hypothetical protein
MAGEALGACPGLSLALIHPTSGKVNSRKFAYCVFYEIHGHGKRRAEENKPQPFLALGQ